MSGSRVGQVKERSDEESLARGIRCVLRRVGLRAAATRSEIQSQGSAVDHDARHGADPHRDAEVPRRPARQGNHAEGLRQPRLRPRRGSLPAGHSGGQCPGPATGLHRRRLPAEPGLRHLRGPGGRPLAVPDPEHGRGLYLGDHRRQGRADGLQVPPGVLGILDDAHFRFVTDLGLSGPDQGKGGKYLVVPPGYKGALPKRGLFRRENPHLQQPRHHSRLRPGQRHRRPS